MRIPRPVPTGLLTLAVLALTPCGVAFALAPPLPAAMTEGATEVTFDAATLNGTVNPEGIEPGSDTRWCFQYGEGSIPGYNLGSVPVLAGDAGTGITSVPVSVRVSGLQPGSAYRYRLVAVNALNTGPTPTGCDTEGGQETVGTEQIFTTTLTLPVPLAETGPANNITQNTATITGTVNPQGSRTIYEFQIGIDTSYGVQIFGQAGEGTETIPVSLNLQYLQPATTYHYRLLATSPAGTSYGPDATLTTTTYPTSTLTPPATTPLLATPTLTFPTTPTQTTTTKPQTEKPKTKKKAKKAKTAKNTRKNHKKTSKTIPHGSTRKGRRST